MPTADSTIVQERANECAEAVYAKFNAIENCVGLIDRMVIGIALPKGRKRDNVWSTMGTKEVMH